MKKDEQKQGSPPLEEKEMSKAQIDSLIKKGRSVVILFGSVYDFTPFLDYHPGGKEIILQYTGKDASEKFIDVGHLKRANIIQTLANLRLGKLESHIKPKL